MEQVQVQVGAAADGQAVATTGVVGTSQPCIRCGYDLRGLPISGACPECAAPVERSLLGDLIAFSSPEYQATIHRGVFLVQAGIIVLALLWGALAATVAMSARQAVAVVYPLVSLVPVALSVWGWWLLSSPDPGQLATNKGESPRRVIRLMVMIQAAVTLVELGAGFLIENDLVTLSDGSGMHVTMWVVRLAWFAASAAQFFAAMLYIKWLATRLPSPRAEKRAKLMLWLGPVLYTGGLLLVGLGPLIALIMYYNLLEWVRKDLKAIRAGGVAHV